MNTLHILIGLLTLSAIGYYLGKRKALTAAAESGGISKLHSRPVYYGALTALWCGLPALIALGCWVAFDGGVVTKLVVADLPEEVRSLPDDRLNLVVNDIRNLVNGNIVAGQMDETKKRAAAHYRQLKTTSRRALAVIALSLGMAIVLLIRGRISPELRARNHVEALIKWFLVVCACVAIVTTIGIVLSVLYEALRFFKVIPVSDFLFGLKWSPQMAIREDQVGASGSFGTIPVLAGTAMVSLIAMLVAVPIGLMSAIYLSEYANRKVRAVAKPLMEILAGVPTVVYGFFAAITVAPFLRGLGVSMGLDVSSESALAAGLVMGIMIIPFVSSISDDVINAVPQSLRDGAFSLGATQSETIKQVVLPAALPGIVGGVLLAISRAIGETMIVVMAAGLSANLTVNPLKAVTTVTVQIVTLLVGDQEFDSPKTLAAFALGLLLFVITLCLNVIALRVVRKYREQYE